MNFLFFVSVSIITFVSVYSSEASAGANRESKPARDPKFHFFRIGRAKDSVNSGSSMALFPRIGRDPLRVYSGNDFESENKRSDSNTALWFGPRLGVQKRDGGHEIPLTYILLNDGNEYRPEYSILPGKNIHSEDEYQSMVFEPLY